MAEINANLWDRAANTWRRLVDTATVAWDTSTPGQASAGVVAGSVGTAQLADNAVSNAKLADMAEATVKGRAVGAGTGDPQDLTQSQARVVAGSLFGHGGAMNLSSSPTTLTAADYGKLVTNFNANRTVNLPSPADGANFSFYTLDGGSGGNLTVNVNVSENIIFEDGTTTTTSVVLTSQQRMTLAADGTNWVVTASNFNPAGLPSFTVANLPTPTAGRLALVTDANATAFASVVAGGGANVVPVYGDGTNWLIG